MSVEAVIKDQFDRMARGRQVQKAAFGTGDNFRTRVDSAADFTYEDRILGASITAMDAALASGAFWSTDALRKWFTLHASYFQTDLALASPYFTSYLATKGWRVPYEAAEAYYEAMQSRLGAQWVFPKGTLVADEADPASAGMHKFQTWVDSGGVETQTVVDGALENCYGAAMLIAATASVTAAGTPKITLTLTDATTVDITLSAGDITALNTQHKQVIVGQQLIGAAGAAAGQKVIPIPATNGFKASCYALVVKADFSAAELVYVASLVANTSITATDNLINTYAQNDLVWPLCSNAIWKAGTIATGGTINIWARPDRIIAL